MRIGVLMGGVSSEREVSLKTGENMYQSISREAHEVERIILDSKDDVFTKCRDIDFALIALHGKYGEDGQIQSILDAMDIPYSGSDVKSSALSMDKDLAKTVIRARGVTTSDWVTAESAEDIETKALPFLREKKKVVVKPNNGGSSVLTFICDQEEQVRQGILKILEMDTEAMVEEFIEGEEVTVAILSGKVLPTIRISVDGGFFDYTAKYQAPGQGGATEEVVRLADEIQYKVDEMAMGTYNALKCSVYGRVDMIIRDNIPYVLEINTLPGMTATSLIPKAAAYVGLSYQDLVARIIKSSVEQRNREKKNLILPQE